MEEEEELEEYDEEDYNEEDSSEKNENDSNPLSKDVEKVDPLVRKVTTETTKVYTQSLPTQKQQAAVASSSIPHQITQMQNGRATRFPAVRSETIPDGFRGKIEEKKYQTRFLPSKHSVNGTDDKEILKPDTYVTVTKSISGSLDNSQSPPADDKKFASTYYTKSSTCGYFTFSCNVVYGSNGRSKICRPKAPNNGKC